MTELFRKKLGKQDGFDLIFSAHSEDLPFEDSLDSTNEDLGKLAHDIACGNSVYFCAQISAHCAGIELSSEYLGCCIYESYEDFLTSNDYIQDMKMTVVEQAKSTLKTINQEVSK